MSKERWEVEWTTEVQRDEFGDYEPDSGTENVQYFKTESEAVKFAKGKVDDDYWGSPRVTLQRLVVTDHGDGGPTTSDWETVRTVEVSE